MSAGMVLWFVTAPFWMGKKKRVEPQRHRGTENDTKYSRNPPERTSERPDSLRW